MAEDSIQRPAVLALYRCPITDIDQLKAKIRFLFGEGGWIVWEEVDSTLEKFTLRRTQRDAYIGHPDPCLQAPKPLNGIGAVSILSNQYTEEILKVWLSKTEEDHTIELEYYPLPYNVYRRGKPLLDIKLLSNQASTVLKAIFIEKLNAREVDISPL